MFTPLTPIGWEEFQKRSARTMQPSWRVDAYATGALGEAGEVLDVVKKFIDHGHPVDPQAETARKMLLEVGDLLWYLCAIATFFGLSMQEIYDAYVVPGLSPARPDFAPRKWTRRLLNECSALYEDAEEAEVLRTEANVHVVERQIGEILWRVEMLCRYYGFDFEQARPLNVEKLHSKAGRYAAGFSPEASAGREEWQTPSAP